MMKLCILMLLLTSIGIPYFFEFQRAAIGSWNYMIGFAVCFVYFDCWKALKPK